MTFPHSDGAESPDLSQAVDFASRRRRNSRSKPGFSGGPPAISGREHQQIGPLPSHVWIRLSGREQVQRKLRVSLTEHCNFGCFFCHNEGQGPVQKRSRAALPADEIQEIVRIALSAGTTKIKLTGGEPLLYREGPNDIVALVRKIDKLRDDKQTFDLSMTTNGSLLPEYAQPLASAGLDRLTVSVTTLSDTTFGELISRNRGLLTRCLDGLRAARAAGLAPLKINTVLYHSLRRDLGNLTEMRDLLTAAMEHGVTELRFFTLLWHEAFAEFGEFYQFFSPEMQNALEALLDDCNVVDTRKTVEALSALAFRFAHRVYPKVEFGVELDSIRLGFEAMKYGRLTGEAGMQEGPYAMRLATDGALRATLNGSASYEVIRGVRKGLADSELRRLYLSALEEMP